MTIGRKRIRQASIVASLIELALLAQGLGELDDQDAVLGGKPDDGHDADGEIDVVRQPAQHRRRHRAEDAERTVSRTASGMVQLS